MTHDECSKLNFDLAPQAPSSEWRVVIFFYAAVHAANHVIFNGTDAPSNYSHDQRALAIQGHKVLRTKIGKYRDLRNLSEHARYKPYLGAMADSHVKHAENIARDFLAACGIAPPPRAT